MSLARFVLIGVLAFAPLTAALAQSAADYRARADGYAASNPQAARYNYLRAAMAGDTTAPAKFAALEAAAKGAPNPEAKAIIDRAEYQRSTASTDKEFAAAKKAVFPAYIQAAELGSPLAINFVIEAYQYGQGVPKDPVKAREWIQINSELGDRNAQTQLGQLMLRGEAGARDPAGARFWFEKAALQGNTLAMFFLAQIYDGGQGLPRNDALASYWYIKAYNEGSAKAEAVLKARGLIRPAPEVQAFFDKIHRQGPDRSSLQAFTYDVAKYCKWGGPRCTELSVEARRMQTQQNAEAETANMMRIWNSYGQSDDGAADRARGDCMARKTESLQRYTYGQQDWYFGGAC